METKDNETPINNQGIRLVKQSEGLNVPLLKPWEVEGERELIGKYSSEHLNIIETKLSRIYEHMQTCKSPTCNAENVFNKVMKFRREHCFPLLKEKEYVLHNTLYALISIYLLSQGNERIYTDAVYLGLSISADMIKANKGK